MAQESDEQFIDRQLANRNEQFMEEQRSIQIAHEQRIMQLTSQLDTRMTVIEVKQGRVETALEKLVETLTIQSTKGILTEAAVVALKEGMEKHSQHIENLQQEQVDTGKVLARLDSHMNIVKAVGAAIISVVIGILASHWFPR